MVTMRPTTFLEKGLNSFISVAVLFILFIPILSLDISLLSKKLIFILFLFVYQIAIIVFNENISIGMIITKTSWKNNYPLHNQFVHAILYTASFSTLLFWIYFPFDLFLINMLFIQLPSILLTGATLHGYLSGKMTTVKKI